MFLERINILLFKIIIKLTDFVKVFYTNWAKIFT